LIIGKGEDVAEALMMEVEALFRMDVVQRDCIQKAIGIVTDSENKDYSYEDFYNMAGLDEYEISGQPIEATNFTDGEENPDGGHTEGCGLSIRWQRGALDFDDDVPWNGCFMVTLLESAQRRLEYYQETKFKCDDNEEALGHIKSAIKVLNRRQVERFCRGVRGGHKK
jgi:hypothetical protein